MRAPPYRYLFAMLLLLVSAVFAANKCIVFESEIHAYSTQQDKYLMRYRDGKTSTGSNAYEAGIAANHRFYPVGTRIFIPSVGVILTVDDKLPETSGNSQRLFVRMLSTKKANAWKPLTEKVLVYPAKNE